MLWFDNKGFETYYFNSSKYEKKHELMKAFYTEFYNQFGVGLPYISETTKFFKTQWKADVKKKISIRLQGKGFTPAAINGFYKKLETWAQS